MHARPPPTMSLPAIRRLPLPGRDFLELRRDALGFFSRIRQERGDLARFRVPGRRLVLLGNPDHVRDLLLTHASKVEKGPALRSTRVLLGDGLLTSEGTVHLEHRRRIQPAFHRSELLRYVPGMVRQARACSDALRNGETVDLARLMMQLTLGIVSEALFGADLRAEARRIGDALTEALGAFRSLSLPLGGWLLALPLPRARRFRAARAELEAAVGSLVSRHGASGPEDLLGRLLDAREGGLFDDRAVRDEVMTLLLAGHETTALALTWAFHLLATHPEVERALHGELDHVLAGRLPAAEDLDSLPITRGVVGESLRLFPPAWVLGRRLLEPLPLTGGTVLPARTVAVVCPWVLHRDARFWPEPERVDPRRWTPEARAARHRHAFIGFGAGTRACVGEGFAWNEAILVLATLASRWRFLPAGPGPVVPDPSVTLRPRGGLPVRVEPRTGRSAP
ncbi:MAG: cytochrome P450 [Myxococcaceae bacterium]|nr:MAG: cytochrome P450 [Myxococcaceae bacterium]